MGMGMGINMSGLGMGYDGVSVGGVQGYEGVVDMGMGIGMYSQDSTVPFDLGMNVGMPGGMGHYHQQQQHQQHQPGLDGMFENANATAVHDPATTMGYTGFEFNDMAHE